ncbi:hypothetical protein [Nitratifractor sp.]|uniref:hypothetical protein n=1 Tax=Nitratifractor sp. TaxID=2268144 RepID=UPI0025D40B89|nr:hypothetical protein [Nitratifractor sp.]
MKKTLIVFLSFILLIAAILFTPPGRNYLLLPAANLYLHYKVPKHRVVLDRLEPGPASLGVSGRIDGSLHFEVWGPVRWFGMHFDLPYRVWAKAVELNGRRYPVHLDLKGTLKGRPSRFDVSGKGNGFDAALSYAFRVEKGQLLGIRAQAHGAQVAQLLALVGRPPYATGRLDLKADIPRYDAANPEGGIAFTVREGEIDPTVLKRDFHLDVPPVKRYTLDGKFRLEKKLLKGEAALHSGLLNLTLRRFRSDRSFRIFKSAYLLDIPELSRLKKLTKQPLYGPWKMGGELYFDRETKRLQLTGVSPSLEGKTTFFYDRGALDLKLNKVAIPSLLAMVGQAPLASSGEVDAVLRLKDLASMEGDYVLQAQGIWNRQEILKLTGTDLGKDLAFSVQSQGRLKKSLLTADARYHSPLVNLSLETLRYEWISGALEGKYRVTLPDLHRLRLFAKARRSYPAVLEGEMAYLPIKKMLKVTGNTRSFGGTIAWTYGGNRLSVDAKGVDAGRLAGLAGVPSLLRSATLNGSLKLNDLAHHRGNFALALKGKLDRQAMRRLYKIDPGHALPIELKSSGKLQGDALAAKASFQTGWGDLSLQKALYRIPSGLFSSDYQLKIPDLSRLKALTGRTYRGPLALAGKVRWDGKLHLNGGGREWGGRIAYALEGSLLRLKTEQIDLQKIMRTLDLSPLLEGRARSDLRYNLTTDQGTLKVESDRIRLVQSPLTQAASLLLRQDLSREIFSRAILSAQMKAKTMLFDFHASSSRFKLAVKQGKIDRSRQRIDALLDIADRGKIYKLKIVGPLSRPKVVPMLTQALEHKIQKVIKNKKIEKVVPKEIRGNSAVGDFIQKLF